MEVLIGILKEVVPFIKDWGALIIAGISLLVAIISLFKSSKAQRLQNKVNELELKIKQNELDKIAKDESGIGKYWVLYAYPWGYADNGLNKEDTSNFKIEWAVDKQGNPVHLPGVDFIKIYTGVNQYCGWLGETSTEVMGINDLHLLNQ